MDKRLDVDWKEIYRVILPAVENNLFTEEVLTNPLAVELLLQAGQDPSLSTVEGGSIGFAAHQGETEVVRLLLEDGRASPTLHTGYAIRQASRYDYTEIVRMLLADPRVDPAVNLDEPIQRASEYGAASVVELLLADPRVDPTRRDSEALRIACNNGHTEVVRLLLKDGRSDPSPPLLPSVLFYAAKNGMDGVVKLLLADPRVHPPWIQSLSKAVAWNHPEVVRLLLADKRTKLEDGGKSLLSDSLVSRRPEMASVIAGGRNIDLQNIDESILEKILQGVPTYHRDSLEGCIALSNGKVTVDELLVLLSSRKIISNHFYILLREVILKELDMKYYLEWLLEQCKRYKAATTFRRLIAEAAESYKNTGTVVHTSPLFTAYSGFLLLAKSSNARAILNTLEIEGASEEGLQLAGMLIGAYLGLRKIS